ncbi:DUF636 domain protein [Rhypophila decipiens]|uniref:DUF636 domain protein n=1 Tax=Rhypophila decipiens TaxID=261697 RepID=A0AAN6XTR5_9PEZI|nr:DUF636 domain protein [Rhypophila decipiens]
MDLPAELPTSHLTLTAQCYCKSVHFTIAVPASALPLPVHLCHCHICRYTHGTPCIFHAPLPKGIAPEFISPSTLEASLTGYEHGQAASTRYFCSSCGCHIGDRDVPDPKAESASSDDYPTLHLEWRVATSIFSLPDISSSGPESDSKRPVLTMSSIFQIRSHVFANPQSSPNGLYNWLPSIDSRPLHIWNPPPDSPDFIVPPPSAPGPWTNSKGEDVLQAECHCSGVSFAIPRPWTILLDPSLPDGFKDLIKTYLPPASPYDKDNKRESGELQRDTNKWSGLLDLCDDCRLVDGTHVIGWTFVPLHALEPQIKSDLKHGTLKTFESSPGVLRAFCSVCGATVFFLHTKDRVWRPDDSGSKHEGVWDGTGEDPYPYMIVDVATGILRAPGGVAAEDWLTWRTARLAWQASGEEYDSSFAKSLERGFAEWGAKTHGKAIDFSIA